LIYFHGLPDSSFLAEGVAMTLLHGFLIATLFGIFASFELLSLTSIWAAIRRMSSPPHPVLKPTGVGNRRDIGTDPDESPVDVVNKGCRTIVVNLFLQAVVLGISGILLFSTPEASAQQWFPEIGTGECVVGAVSAAVLGIVVRTMWWNWGMIINLYNRMVRPPNPALPRATPVAAAAGAATETPSGGVAAVAAVVIAPGPPNVHYVGATPTISPLDVLGQGCLEIVARLILQALLFGVLGFWILLVYNYMSYQ
jgi:hypothetical protein